MDKPTILIIEDNRELASGLADFLADTAKVDMAYDGLVGEEKALANHADLLILDIMLPGQDGLTLLKNIRQMGSDIPVLILTAKDTIVDKLKGFQAGSDDYLTKPFHREELLMRVKSLLRRAGKLNKETKMVFGPINLNLAKHTVMVNGQVVDLKGKEFDLLEYLIENPEMIITKEQIFDRLWGFDSETSLSVVEVYMSNLRKKLKPVQADGLIKTIRNVGYIVEESDEGTK